MALDENEIGTLIQNFKDNWSEHDFEDGLLGESAESIIESLQSGEVKMAIKLGLVAPDWPKALYEKYKVGRPELAWPAEDPKWDVVPVQSGIKPPTAGMLYNLGLGLEAGQDEAAMRKDWGDATIDWLNEQQATPEFKAFLADMKASGGNWRAALKRHGA